MNENDLVNNDDDEDIINFQYQDHHQLTTNNNLTNDNTININTTITPTFPTTNDELDISSYSSSSSSSKNNKRMTNNGNNNKDIVFSTNKNNNNITEKENTHLYKILVVGDYAVGKTSLIRRYCTGEFTSNYRITIGVDFCLKHLDYNDNTNVSLQLWDIAGHERFGAMTRVYYKYAIAAVVCFDISRPSTLDNVKKWRDDINSKVVLPNVDNGNIGGNGIGGNHSGDGVPIPMILLANKCDLPEITIDKNKMNKFAKENGFVAWFETSAKKNINIENAFEFLVSHIMSITSTMNLQNSQQLGDLNKSDLNIIGNKKALENKDDNNNNNGKGRGCCG